MNILLIFPGFIVALIIVFCYEFNIRRTELRNKDPNKNKVHFYVARDMSGSLWLYMGKPIRFENFFACGHGQVLVSSDDFPKYGLNIHDFDNLKWEDEPVEVFINMED